jgi:uncharacterized Zn finger protein
MFGPYVTVAEQRQRAMQAAQKLAKAGRVLQPIEVAGREICHTWWGLSWCRNLEYFSDFANRLPRGRTYVRSGAVLELRITSGLVEALVQGSDLYEVKIKIKPLPADRKKELCDRCAADIGSTIDLLSGKFDRNIMNILTEPKRGLFPEPREIEFECSCPDFATVCKHVAATLYGIGVRFDASPELFFTLRGIDPGEFVTAATTGLTSATTLPFAENTLAGASRQELGAVFGIDFAPEADSTQPQPLPETRPTAAPAATVGTIATSFPALPAPSTSGAHCAPAEASIPQSAQSGISTSNDATPIGPVTIKNRKSAHSNQKKSSSLPRTATAEPLPSDVHLPSSSIEAYVDSLFDPRTGQPIDVDASHAEAATEPAAALSNAPKPAAKARHQQLPQSHRGGSNTKSKVGASGRSSTTTAERPQLSSSKRRNQPFAAKTADSKPLANAAKPSRRRSPNPGPAPKKAASASPKAAVLANNCQASKSSAAKVDSSNLRPTGRSSTRPRQKTASSKSAAKRNRLTIESPKLLSSKKTTTKTARSALPKELRPRIQPGQILTMAELRALGISYPAV